MSMESIERFVRLLKQSPPGAVFNPWWQVDKQNDIGRNAPLIRRKHLRAYLRKRLGKAKVVVIGEALGYRGGHFSGIPMTSERILLGKKENVGIKPEHVFSNCKQGEQARLNSARMVFPSQQRRLSGACCSGLAESRKEFVLWNAFPWHSFDPRRGLLSNRTTKKSERPAGLSVLKAFLDLFPCEEIIALGNVAAWQLKELNVECHRVRHPASGGARLFRQGIRTVMKDVR